MVLPGGHRNRPRNSGKWQIMRLLGRDRDSEGDSFRLGAFHDKLISYGTLPLSVVEWLMFDDDSSVRQQHMT